LFLDLPFLSTPIYSQNLLKKISVNTCDCIHKIEMKSDSASFYFGTAKCLSSEILKNKNQIVKELKVNMSNPDSVIDLTRKIFYNFSKECQEYKRYSLQFNQAKVPYDKVKYKAV
jgi:hypothetical protein